MIDQTAQVGVCRWCRQDIEWDHYAGWRHVDSHSLLCPDGSIAVIDTEASRAGWPVPGATR